MREQIKLWRAEQETIALVPTMGHLHAGHASLIELARQNATRTVVSIYINPLQFNIEDDFKHYPRSLEDDLKILNDLKVDAVFNPEDKELYPQGHQLAPLIKIPELGREFCGQYRPGHFDGVCTVVAKLFNIVAPHVAIFGKKDYQQLLIIQRMVTDLDFDLQIIAGETQRDQDGLALSSRNTHLNAEERAIAPVLSNTLEHVKDSFSVLDIHQQEATAAQHLEKAGLKVEYLNIRDAQNLQPITNSTKNVVVLAAVWLGRTRLIDNRLFPLD